LALLALKRRWSSQKPEKLKRLKNALWHMTSPEQKELPLEPKRRRPRRLKNKNRRILTQEAFLL